MNPIVWTVAVAVIVLLALVVDIVRIARRRPRMSTLICGDEWALLKFEHRVADQRREMARGR